MGTLETADDPAQAWKVGVLARATGLTVRALHYYDEIGLLRPSRRSSAGHRLYDAADVARLYRISLLRRLGFPLEQKTSVLDDPEWQLAAAVDRHLGHTQRRAASATRLSTRLASMAAELAQQESPSPEQLFSTLEEMAMLDGTIHSTTGLLVYDDISAAQDYIVRVFGLTAGLMEHDPDGNVGYREVRAGDQVIGLHPAASKDVQSPRSLGAVTGMTVIAVDDADAHYARSVQAGAEIVQEPVDQQQRSGPAWVSPGLRATQPAPAPAPARGLGPAGLSSPLIPRPARQRPARQRPGTGGLSRAACPR